MKKEWTSGDVSSHESYVSTVYLIEQNCLLTVSLRLLLAKSFTMVSNNILTARSECSVLEWHIDALVKLCSLFVYSTLTFCEVEL